MSLYDKIEKDVAYKPMVLRCETYGREERLQSGEFAKYLHIGWPKCCGQTMLLDYVDTPVGQMCRAKGTVEETNQ